MKRNPPKFQSSDPEQLYSRRRGQRVSNNVTQNSYLYKLSEDGKREDGYWLVYIMDKKSCSVREIRETTERRSQR